LRTIQDGQIGLGFLYVALSVIVGFVAVWGGVMAGGQSMKAEASAPGANVSQALTKGACPICAILKDFQWTLAETARPQSDLRVCNFHGGRSLDPEQRFRAPLLGRASQMFS